MSDATPKSASSGQSSNSASHQTPYVGPTTPPAASPAQRAAGGALSSALMRCAEAQPYLSAYADGELAEPLRAVVAAHVAGCAACRAEVERSRAVDRLLASLPATAPSPEVYARVQAAVARRGLDTVVRE